MEINPNALLALVAEQQATIMVLRQENHHLRQQASNHPEGSAQAEHSATERPR